MRKHVRELNDYRFSIYENRRRALFAENLAAAWVSRKQAVF